MKRIFSASTSTARTATRFLYELVASSYSLQVTRVNHAFSSCLKTDASGKLTAAVWGEKGGFEAESKSYSVADLRHIFWVTLSENAKIIYPKELKTIDTDGLNAISSFVFLDDNAIIVQGIHEIGGAGLYLLKEGIEPIELTFNQEKIAYSITGLEVSNGSLYLINVNGKLYKVK